MAKEVSPGVKALRKVVDDVHADARRAHAEGLIFHYIKKRGSKATTG